MQKDLRLNNLLSLLLFCFSANLFSQTDTLFTLKKEKISCHIIEISEESLIFRTNGNKDKIDINDLIQISFKNGIIEKFEPKAIKFDLTNPTTRAIIQAKASQWGTQVLKCAFSNVSLNTTYVDWDQTYKQLGADSTVYIGLKTYYAVPGIEDKEQIYWKVKTTTSLITNTFYFIRVTDNMTSDATFLNCIHKLNRANNLNKTNQNQRN